MTTQNRQMSPREAGEALREGMSRNQVINYLANWHMAQGETAQMAQTLAYGTIGQDTSAVSPQTAQAALFPGTALAVPSPSPNQPEYLSDPEFFQGIFERARGIPTAGRNPYQAWLAGQWQRPASAYALSQTPEFGTGTPMTFEQYLSSRQGQGQPLPFGQQGGNQLQQLTGLGGQAERAVLENLPSYVRQNVFTGALRQRYPSFIAQGLAGQAMAPAALRQFEISPQGLDPESSWLSYLRGTYGL